MSIQAVCLWLQGFASVSEKVAQGATVWGAHHLPQNREVFMVGAGDGSLYLYKYHYPDQRQIKVSRNMHYRKGGLYVPLTSRDMDAWSSPAARLFASYVWGEAHEPSCNMT